MNPSANGWIKKLLIDISGNDYIKNSDNEIFYTKLRHSGFIYGSNMEIVDHIVDRGDFTEEEICKTNFCLAFLNTYYQHKTTENFIDSVINFYAEINTQKTSFLQDLLGGKKSEEQLEKIIHRRIQIDDNVLTKNFNYHIINALLYIDILAYQHYLRLKCISPNYVENIELAIEAISINVLKAKAYKNDYDESLIKLFESSFRYAKQKNISYQKAITLINTPLEQQYIIDLACMATWSDHNIDDNEKDFLYKLGNDLQIDSNGTKNSIDAVNHFYTQHKDHIALLSSKNVVKSFYNNSSKMVKKLITRNSKRLYKELKDSKELMVLLTQSTVRDLTPNEQKKVQEQLLDIFKSIPSLAIFLLPGGAILLPLVIKFIPKLLPSAFDDNRIEE
ncbi:MAG: LETM1-related biofilm-associated protein [Aestuariibaculum sp.]